MRPLRGTNMPGILGHPAAFSDTVPRVISIVAGVWLTLIFGLWLVHNVGYGYGDGWIVAALVLWFALSALGGFGGRRDRKTRELAEKLAAGGDAPAPDLSARVRDPISLAASYSSAGQFKLTNSGLDFPL